VTYPKPSRGSELCITVEPDGVHLYGNRASLRTFAAWFAWLAEAKSSEHYETHLRFFLDGFGRRPATWVLFHEKIRRAFGTSRDFEVTVMAVEPKDLRALRRWERRGVLPPNWRKEDTQPSRTRSARPRSKRR
jgi:hypothetical protein